MSFADSHVYHARVCMQINELLGQAVGSSPVKDQMSVFQPTTLHYACYMDHPEYPLYHRVDRNMHTIVVHHKKITPSLINLLGLKSKSLCKCKVNRV